MQSNNCHNDKRPLVSIVTPNYNYGSFISETIESLLRQDYPNIEHIIVDDGSTDNSVDIIQSYAQHNSQRIRLIIQENRGQTAAINTGLKNSHGDILGWINSDDTYFENIINTVVNFFTSHKTINILYGDANVVDIKGHFIYRIRHLPFDYTAGCLLGFAKITTSNTIFWRRSRQNIVGYLKEDLISDMDGEFYSRLMQNAKIRYIPVAFANFRKQIHPKAAETQSNWIDIANSELRQELMQSYSTLYISKIIPFNYIQPLRFFYRCKRIILRSMKMHYLRQYHEKLRYKRDALYLPS
jgi:glycosyltransferase involved in cell wall biosynthesis